MTSPPTLTVRIKINGKVQGVGFRDWAVARAKALGLDGYVRNRPDGSVEALARGPAPAIRSFIESCRQGPLMAKVSAVEADEVEAMIAPGFKRLPSG